jgi:hypothetical protein
MLLRHPNPFVLFVPPKSTRVWEPTLSWNQFHKQTMVLSVIARLPPLRALATAAYAHQSEVNAYRLNSITTSSIARFAVPKITIILIFEKNREPQVAIT